MSFVGTLKVSAKGDRELVMAREFNADQELVFECFTTPDLVKKWLHGPDGWEMIVCEIDLKVGGKYRYVWKSLKDGTIMGMGGEYKEISGPKKIVCTEVFDESWYAGDAIVTTTFTESKGITSMVVTILYGSKETRDMVIKSPMEGGVAQSYNRLETLLNGLTETAKRK
ncbi:SRPBCC family protein [Leptospira sarikeiensis]|uniref:ATPase n=1 Tax=Leptospira sarikeiensis TaxID=2484943 RepID=A0A4R9KAY9_9LEPT|nr:SRPBCC family protein [Leptospira sarikeiensis]TGL63005.1 ATPase [Leptospira sarikeiensis]